MHGDRRWTEVAQPVPACPFVKMGDREGSGAPGMAVKAAIPGELAKGDWGELPFSQGSSLRPALEVWNKGPVVVTLLSCQIAYVADRSAT